MFALRKVCSAPFDQKYPTTKTVFSNPVSIKVTKRLLKISVFAEGPGVGLRLKSHKLSPLEMPPARKVEMTPGGGHTLCEMAGKRARGPKSAS